MSDLRVLKFGGSSLASAAHIHNVAQIVKSHYDVTKKVIVVVSAMGKSTDQLIRLARELSPHAQSLHRRELDMMISTGERISMSLLSMAIRDLGVEALSLTGSQSGIITSDNHGEAEILEIKGERIEKALLEEKIVIVAGFQGVSLKKEITTLGRGGSDTSALALASHFKAKSVSIYSDVAAYHSADPKLVKNTLCYEVLPWELGYLSSYYGAKVLHSRAAEAAALNQVEIHLLSTFNPQTKGGRLVGSVSDKNNKFQVFTINLKKGLQKLTTIIQADLAKRYPSELGGLFSAPLTVFKDSIIPSELFTYFDENLAEHQVGREKIYSNESEYWSISLVGTQIQSKISLLEEVSSLLDAFKLKVLAYNSHALVFTVIVPAFPESEGPVLQSLHDHFISQ